MNILIINGPNLNLLGKREPDLYGSGTYENLLHRIAKKGLELGLSADVVQHSGEGEIIDAIHGAMGRYDGLVVNPGAYTHYSYAIHDALKAAALPAIEVHLTNIAAREAFRRVSVTAPACLGQISGLGIAGYELALAYLWEHLK